MTTRPEPPSQPPPGASEAEPWLAVSDALLAAVNHALNNRLAALISLVRVLEYGDTAANPLLTVLQEEVDRLEQTVTHLRLLPRDPAEGAEPVLLADVFASALGLHRLRGSARDLEYQVVDPGDLPPIWAPPTALAHALLMLLAALTPASAAEDVGAFRVEYGGTEDEASVAVEPPAGLAVPLAGIPNGQGTADPLAAVATMLERMGGSLTRSGVGGEGLRVEVRLPSLAAVRRREAGGAEGST